MAERPERLYDNGFTQYLFRNRMPYTAFARFDKQLFSHLHTAAQETDG